nr:FecR domain-containing protein [uncultured Hyphomonas sp.]
MSADYVLPSARDSEQVAADWVARLDREGLLSACTDVDALCQDEEDFALWLNAEMAHRVAFLRALSAWSRAERLSVLRSNQPAPRKSFVRRPAVQMLAAAACVAMAILVVMPFGLFGGEPAAPQPLHYQTARGEMKTLTLEDGSVLTLNTDTSVDVTFSDDKRQVALIEGEAFFDVAKAPERPFLIDAGEGQVRVLGTSFGVERRQGVVEVAVSEGTVWVGSSAQKDASESILTPGMIGYASANGVIVETTDVETVSQRLMWREGRLKFNDTPLRDVAAEFNRYNTIQLVVTDEATGDIEIGGTFRLDNVEAFARLANDGLGLDVSHAPGRIELSSK